MAEPQIGSRDSQGRYYHGPVKGYMSLSDLMKDYNKKMKPGLFGIKQGETRKLPGVGDIVYDKKYGWQTKATYERGLIEPSKRPPKPETQPPTPAKPSDDGKGLSPAPSPQGTAERDRLEAEIEAANRARRRAEPKPEPKPEPTPRPTPRPTPQPSSEVTSYLRAAAAARKSGNQAEMDKVRQTGMDIWRKKYANTLAKKVSPTGQQLGTGQSVMAKQAAELRSLRDTAPAGTPPSGMTLSRQYQGNDMPGRLGQLETGYAGKPRPKPQPIVKKEAYDVVLDYLLSEGHADTVEEANYVMMQMDAEHIQSIVEQQDTILPAEAAFNKSTPEQRAAYKKKYGYPYPPPDTSRRAGGGYNQAPAWMRGGFQSRAEYDALDPETKALLEP